MKRIFQGLAIATALAPLAVQADAPYLYAGGAFGASILEADVDSGTFKGSDYGLKLFGGYRFTDNWGFELAYTDLGEMDDTVNGVDLEVDTSGWEFSGVGYLPLQSIDLFGKVGLFAWESEATASLGGFSASDDEDGTDLTIGFGASLPVTPNLDIRGEYQWYDIEDSDTAAFLSVGADFRF